MLVVLVGPTCSGKTSVMNFLKIGYGAKVIPTHTSREPRGSDEDYEFLSVEEFDQMINDGKLIEYDEFAGDKYGTSVDDIERFMSDNSLCVKALTIEGARAVKKLYGERVVTIFLKPKDPNKWVQLVKEHRRDSDVRIRSYYEEVEHSSSFDYEIVNEDLSAVFYEVSKIIGNKLQLT